MTERSMGVEAGPDGRRRCWWCLGSPEYIDYHDREWGRPLRDDTRLFELLGLVTAHADIARHKQIVWLEPAGN